MAVAETFLDGETMGDFDRILLTKLAELREDLLHEHLSATTTLANENRSLQALVTNYSSEGRDRPSIGSAHGARTSSKSSCRVSNFPLIEDVRSDDEKGVPAQDFAIWASGPSGDPRLSTASDTSRGRSSLVDTMAPSLSEVHGRGSKGDCVIRGLEELQSQMKTERADAHIADLDNLAISVREDVDAPMTPDRQLSPDVDADSDDSSEEVPVTPKEGLGGRTWSKQSSENSNTSPRMVMSRMDSFGGTFNNKTYKMRDEWSKHSQLFYEPLLEMVSQKAYRSNSFSICGSIRNSRVSVMSGIWTSQYRYMMHPACKKRVFWNLATILLLMYDAVVIPIDLCFEVEPIPWMGLVQFIARLFWSIDIVLTFFTGIYVEGLMVEAAPKKVARVYAKFWLPFDLFLVGTEWLMLGFSEVGGFSFLSMLRSFRGFRVIRLLRVIRFARIAKLKPMLRAIIVLSSEGVAVTMRFGQVLGLCVAFTHFTACLWHLAGAGDEGWVVTNHMESDTVARKYLVSLHWIYCRLQGASSNIIVLRSSTQIFFDTMVLFASLLLSAWLLATVSQTVVHWAHSDVSHVQRICVAFMRRHGISKALTKRTQKFLRSHQLQGAGEVLNEEKMLIEGLPNNLQDELMYNARAPLLCNSPCFDDVNGFDPRYVRHLCTAAVTEVLAITGEEIFQLGDACSEMLFVRSGTLRYDCDEDLLINTPRVRMRPEWRQEHPCEGSDILARDDVICEVVLWTHWENTGTLVPLSDAIVLSIDMEKFYKVAVQHMTALVHAVKFGRYFVKNMNRSEVCDLTSFAIDIDALDAEVGSGGTLEHLVFISHYKTEAGTEATLMRDLLERMVREEVWLDFASEQQAPIFVDSEDLVDLAKLTDHVKGSSSLILLLTPGVLTRPWCLLEIVVAVKFGVVIVPVEIKRPDLKFKYPDERFYRELYQVGKVLTAADIMLLQNEGCPLEDIEAAVRQVFLKISLPFSPHNTGNVRRAELVDVMKRCTDGRSTACTSGSPLNRSPNWSPNASIETGRSNNSGGHLKRYLPDTNDVSMI